MRFKQSTFKREKLILHFSGFVYPVVSHWVWTDHGWLQDGVNNDVKYQDFAGSSVVHMVGGMLALIGAIAVGPRLGRFDRNAKSIQGHTVPVSRSHMQNYLMVDGIIWTREIWRKTQLWHNFTCGLQFCTLFHLIAKIRDGELYRDFKVRVPFEKLSRRWTFLMHEIFEIPA